MSKEEQATKQFTSLFEAFALRRAHLQLAQQKEQTGSDVVAILTPENPNSAQIDARLELDFGVYLLFGRISTFEVPFNREYGAGQSWLSQLDALCSSVIEGGLRECVVSGGSEIVSGKTILTLPCGKVVREHWTRLCLGLLHKKSSRNYTYAPYTD